MVRSKNPSKKPQARGVDFKKFKKKLGRTLPPPNNATNTEIKSKAIILPEQSVASDKAGMAVSKKGLTLKELLQQTSHHNVKIRKDALMGIKELLLKFPAELKLHKLAIIEKLRERISDDDKSVRETLYQLFKSVVLPGCKEENQTALISVIMAYIFNAMTQLSIDVRLMAFKFFDLVVQNFPPAFSLYAEKVLENYLDILQKNQFHLEDKNKLKIALSGLNHCLSLLPSTKKEVHPSVQYPEKQVLYALDPVMPKAAMGDVLNMKLKDLIPALVNCFDGLISASNSQKLLDPQSFDCLLSILHSIGLVVEFFVRGFNRSDGDQYTTTLSSASLEICVADKMFPPQLLNRLFAVFPFQPTHHQSEKDAQRYYILNAKISQIFFTFSQWIDAPPVLLDGFLNFLVGMLSKTYTGEPSDKVFYEKHHLLLVPFIPELLLTVDWSWRGALIQVFTLAFISSNPDSPMKMACLRAVGEMLISKRHILKLDAAEDETLDHQRTWICEIIKLLNSLGSRQPSSSHEVLHIQLRLGQIGLENNYLAAEYDKTQDDLRKFYCIRTEDGNICYGPFKELSRESQYIAICCLYYFSSLKQPLLASLALCCLSDSLESSVLFRIIEVIHSSYNAGHIQIADYISFLVTLLSQYEVTPAGECSKLENEARKSNIDTLRAITGVICSFLSQMGDQSLVLQILEEVILNLISDMLPLDNIGALLRVLVTVDSRPSNLSEKSITRLSDVLLSYFIDVALLFVDEDCSPSSGVCAWKYYLLPCFILLDRSPTLMKQMIDKVLCSVNTDSCEIPFLRDTEINRDHPRKIKAIVFMFSMICKDFKMRTALSSCKSEIDNILKRILVMKTSAMSSMSIQQQHLMQSAVATLKNVITEI